MKHEILKPKQKEWLQWLLGDGRYWMSIHINAPENLKRLNWTYINGIYDVGTKQLLNYLLIRFNENVEAKKDWRNFQKYKTM